MLDFNPMDLKFYMLILDTLMDVLVLVWHFSHAPFLFYECVCMVWQFVSHLWLFLLVQFNFHANISLMLLIFCMMIMLDVLNAHEFFQNYLNHFCFDLEFSFSMSIWMLWNCLWLPLHMKCLCLMIFFWSFLGHVNMCLKLHCVEY